MKITEILNESIQIAERRRKHKRTRRGIYGPVPYHGWYGFGSDSGEGGGVEESTLKEFVPGDSGDNSGDNHLSLESIARIIALQLGNKCAIVPGKNKKQPSFRIIPNDKTKYNSIRIWSVTNPRTKQAYPTYNTILFVDESGKHVERGKANTLGNAIATAKLLNKNVTKDNLQEKWSRKYKRSIDCSHPKGFSQRAHCQGRKK